MLSYLKAKLVTRRDYIIVWRAELQNKNKLWLAKTEFILYKINHFQNDTGRLQFHKRLVQVALTLQRFLQLWLKQNSLR